MNLNKPVTIYSIVIITTFLSVFFAIKLNDSKNNPNFSIAKNANLITKINNPNLIIKRKIKSQKVIIKSNDLDIKKIYFSQYKKGQNQLANNIRTLEQEHTKLLKDLREAGVKIDQITKLKPRLHIALSVYLDLKPEQLNTQDIISLNLSNREFFLLKSFSESNDFILLLKRGELVKDHFNFERLEKNLI